MVHEVGHLIVSHMSDRKRGAGGQELVLIPVAADPEKGRAYLAFPNEGNVRWLVLAEPVLRRAGLRLLRPSRTVGKAAKWLMVAGLLWGDRVRLDEAVLSELEERFASLLEAPETRLALYAGTPGAYRKVTIQIMSPRGDVLGYAKAADRPLARAALETERDILVRLSLSAALRDHIPRVLGWMEWRDCALLITSGGPPAPGPKRLGEAHMAFLDRLWHVEPQYHRFRDSPLRARWQKTMDRYDGHFPDPWRQRYRAALERLDLDAALAGVDTPFSFAHRDFAPWNTCQGTEALFVFDWEGAVDDAPPLYDAFHFQAIQAALRGKRLRLDIDFLRRLGVRIWRPSEECLESLFLAYLMDISLYYAEARVRAPEVGEESVWHWFGNQIDRSLDDANRVA